jgi:hypothetical protein
MCRSILNLTCEEFKRIKRTLTSKTLVQQRVRDNLRLFGDERSKLEEKVLEKFEFWTNELHSSQVSISKERNF